METKQWQPPRTNQNGSDTKYRDIADGNLNSLAHAAMLIARSDTKYRDIADGNPVPQLKEKSQHVTLKTKYRDIAATNQLPREKFLHVRQFSRTMTD